MQKNTGGYNAGLPVAILAVKSLKNQCITEYTYVKWFLTIQDSLYTNPNLLSIFFSSLCSSFRFFCSIFFFRVFLFRIFLFRIFLLNVWLWLKETFITEFDIATCGRCFCNVLRYYMCVTYLFHSEVLLRKIAPIYKVQLHVHVHTYAPLLYKGIPHKCTYILLLASPAMF